MENSQLITQLRKAAQELRKEASAVRRKKQIKCAQAMVAARGLAQLRQILKGEYQ